MSIGEHLRRLRTQKGETLDEASANIGITKSSLAMYERDERVPRDQVKIKLSEYYHESVQSLFFNS